MDGHTEPNKETCEHEDVLEQTQADHIDGYIQCRDCKTILVVEWDWCDSALNYVWYAVKMADCQVPWWMCASVDPNVRKCEIRIDEECADIATHTVFDLEYMVDCCAPCADHADSHSTVEAIDEGGA